VATPTTLPKPKAKLVSYALGCPEFYSIARRHYMERKLLCYTSTFSQIIGCSTKNINKKKIAKLVCCKNKTIFLR